jgi:hypothetical protein
MAKFFNYYPKTYYTNDNKPKGLDTVTNIIFRFAFEQSLKENSAAFYKYNIQDSDTPEIIAYKYYGNSERHWVVLLFNNIIDPQWDWPLTERNLVKYVNEKYSANGAANTTVQTGIQWALSLSNVQAYYKTITRTSADGSVITEKLEIDANTHANISQTTATYTLQNGSQVTERVTRSTRSYFEYETELNDAKREITLLKKEFAPAVEKEFKRIISS